MALRYFEKRPFVRKLAARFLIVAVLGGGLLLMYFTLRRGLAGDQRAIWLLLSFTLVMIVLFSVIKKFWVLALDDRDVLDIFTVAAINNKAHLAHFHREFFHHSRIVTERGYSYSMRDADADLRISLVYLGKEDARQRTEIGEQPILTVAVRVPQPFKMAIVNPQVELQHTLEVDFYAPLVLNSTKYVYHKYGIVFSEYYKNEIEAVFENPFLHTELIELFTRFRFKFAIFDERKAMAVKMASVETLGHDVEAYPILINISNLIASTHKKHSTLSPDKESV
ncbi:MAG: hypothetical protein KDC45_06375 [Bacteroidetes bacterium]|nr:hypothetical protein [Bacteroidota bacterium]